MGRHRLAALLTAGLAAGCDSAAAPSPPDLEGTYTMCREVRGYSGETVVLKKDGRFRYWFYSDVRRDNEPGYPLEGRFRLEGATVHLDHPQIHSPSRTLDIINGVPVLWRADGLELWSKERRLHPYAVLLRVEAGPADGDGAPRSSLDLLKSPGQEQIERNRYERRYADRPPEIRALLRALTAKGDPNREAYRVEVVRARAQLDRRLLDQLVAGLGDRKISFEALGILSNLFERGAVVKEPPPFRSDPEAQKKALEALIEATGGAPDMQAIDELVLLFMRIKEIRKIDLPVPEVGVRLVLELDPAGASRSRTEITGGFEDRVRVPRLAKAVQDWMRARVR